MARGASSREKILEAASDLAFRQGAAHLSLDAVAACAGVSKGGLLYNFPNKAALMKALVEKYLEDFRTRLDEATEGEDSNLPVRYLDLAVAKLERETPSSSGLLAALAEDPSLLAPVKEFNRTLLDRMKAGGGDVGAILVLFLVLEGMRAQNVFGTAILEPEERRLVLERVAEMIGAA
ncbi:TetR/AcrR family transcriptional regulator [Oricola sp.]|uniref:TetR/AcrR family transcriptional regulator n=1 Tax=Oricola sp. TaxID=1979950 RepID=UPI0035127A14